MKIKHFPQDQALLVREMIEIDTVSLGMSSFSGDPDGYYLCLKSEKHGNTEAYLTHDEAVRLRDMLNTVPNLDSPPSTTKFISRV